jgi:uncharacterized protein DUF1876
VAQGNKHHPRSRVIANYTCPPPPPGSAAPYAAVQVLHDKNASVAHVSLSRSRGRETPDYYLKGTGASKRERGDVHDEVTGEMLALSRALTDLARQLQSEAARRVKASTEAQYAAQLRALEKREAAKRPVKRRTKEEWEAMQREQAGYPPGTFHVNLGAATPRDPVDVEKPAEPEGLLLVTLVDGREVRLKGNQIRIPRPDGREGTVLYL